VLCASALEFVAEASIQSSLNSIAAAFAGGTVGVMGSLVAIELRRLNLKEKAQCPYCRGRGVLPCATCAGSGTELKVTDQKLATCSESLAKQEVLLLQESRGDISFDIIKCECCEGKTTVLCTHCEGDGRLVPEQVERAVQRRGHGNEAGFDPNWFGF